MNRILMRIGAVTVLAGIAAACAGTDDPLERSIGAAAPDEPGLFATTRDGELQRLDGTSEWESKTWPRRANLSPDARFLVHDPAVATGGTELRLWRVAWARSEVSGPESVMPRDGSRWVVARLSEFEVPVSVQRLEGRADYVLVTPKGNLAPGLYQLEFGPAGNDRRARIGIGWPGLDERNYASRNCVDRYSGINPPFRACSEQGSTLSEMSRQGLTIDLGQTEVRDGALIVNGSIVNSSRDYRDLPPMEAELVDRDGNVLDRWLFRPVEESLPPGASVRFTTSNTTPPRETARVNVRFAEAG